jgi:hypothetical protein
MRWIVSYDLRDQVAAARGAFRWMRGWSGRDRRFVPNAPDRPGSEPASGGTGVALSIVLLLTVLAATVIAARRRGLRRPRHREAHRILRAIDGAFRRLGHPRPLVRTPREHAGSLTDDVEKRAILDRAIELYGAARFGGAVIEPSAIRATRRALRSLAVR